jgi:hemerythrin-like domain-containing protein
VKPTEILVNEHRIIEQVLNCLERMVERCRTAGRLEREPAEDAIAFFREFAECSHLAKEEAHLFPLVAGAKCPQGCRPAELMSREKAHGHSHLEAMAGVIEGAAAGNKDATNRFTEHGEAYIGLLMKYIENEEDWLFHQADRLLSEDSQRILIGQFQTTNTEEACGRSPEQYVALANRLADHFGVPRAVLLDA